MIFKKGKDFASNCRPKLMNDDENIFYIRINFLNSTINECFLLFYRSKLGSKQTLKDQARELEKAKRREESRKRMEERRKKREEKRQAQQGIFENCDNTLIIWNTF